MPRRLLLEGAAIEPLLRQARAEHGQGVRIVKAEKVRMGGVGGFFAKERYEVTVEIDDEAGAGSTVPAQGGAAPTAAESPAPRGIAALLAAAEEAERGSASPPAVSAGPSPSAAALAAVREAMASREATHAAASTPEVVPGPAVAAGRGFGDVLAALRAGDRAPGSGDTAPGTGGPGAGAGAGAGADGDVRAPDDARSITQDLAIAAQDPDQTAALEAVRRALDALGIVDDTAEITAAASAAAAAAAEPAATSVIAGPAAAPAPATPVPAGPVPPHPAAPSPDVPAFRPSVPERLVLEHPDDGSENDDVVQEPTRAEPPSAEEAVAMLQELPSSPVSPAGAGGTTEPADHPMTRRERRLAEAVEAAEVSADVEPAESGVDLPDADLPSADLVADVEPSEPSEPSEPADDQDADDQGADASEGSADLTSDAVDDDLLTDDELPTDDDPASPDGEAHVDDAVEPADEPAPDDGDTHGLALPGPVEHGTHVPAAVGHDEPAPQPPELPTTLAGLGEPEPGEALPDLPSVPAVLAATSRGEPSAPTPATPPRDDLGTVADRLERLGIDRRWLHDVPDDLSSALRQLARRLAASPPLPRRSPRAADNPLVAVLAEDANGLETAAALAVGLGLRVDEVTVLSSGGTAGARSRSNAVPARRGGVPLDRAAAARAAHGGRRRTAPAVVLVPTPFAAPPGERAAAAAVLASLDADQVWAVVDATRRTSDVEGWLRTVGPPSGVDAVALVGTGSTTAPAASLRLSVPVVLLDGRPATAVDWVVHLAAHLVREDLEDHLDPRADADVGEPS